MRNLLVVSCLILTCGMTLLAQSSRDFTDEQVRELAMIKHKAEAALELGKSGIITESQAQQAVKLYLGQAGQTAGRQVSFVELAVVPETTVSPAPPSYMSKVASRVAGWVSFGNIMISIGVLIGVVSVLVLFWRVIVDLLEILALIPVAFYEALTYAIAFTLVVGGKHWAPDLGYYIGLFGSLLLSGCIGFTLHYHVKYKKNYISLGFLIATAVFVVTAIYYGSALIGVFASLTFMWALGFFSAMAPMCYIVGFTNDEALARGTSVSFFVLALFVVLRATETRIITLEIFAPGMLFMGSFVGYLGLLIVSSKWYSGKNFGGYTGRQVFTVILGTAALGFGSVLGIPELLKVGGTFFSLYLIEKISEIIDALDIKNAYGWCAIGIIVAAGLIYIGTFVVHHQTIFHPYLLFL